MRLIAGSILTGFSLLARTLGEFDGGNAFRSLGPESWDVGINIPIGLEIVIWLFLTSGVALMVWEISEIVRSRRS